LISKCCVALIAVTYQLIQFHLAASCLLLHIGQLRLDYLHHFAAVFCEFQVSNALLILFIHLLSITCKWIHFLVFLTLLAIAHFVCLLIICFLHVAITAILLETGVLFY